MPILSSREKKLTLAYTVGALSLIVIIFVLFLISKGYRFRKFDRPGHNFSIKYPASWTMEENTNGVAAIFYSPLETDLDFFQDNVNVVERSYPEDPKDIKDYAEMAVKQMQAVFKENFILLEMTPTFFATYPAYRISFIGKGPQGELKFLILCTRKGETSYQITYAAMTSQYDKYLDKVNSMISSFKIKQ